MLFGRIRKNVKRGFVTRKKEKTLLMFPDNRRRINGFASFIGFLYNIARVLAIISAVVMLITTVFWPIIAYIILPVLTIGLIFIGGIPSASSFTDFFFPIAIGTICAALGLFVIKMIIEWSVISKTRRELKKDTEENKHYIALSRFVLKQQIVDLVMFVITSALSVVALIFLSKINTPAATQANTAVPIICAVVVLAARVLAYVYLAMQFKRVETSADAIRDIRAAAAKAKPAAQA